MPPAPISAPRTNGPYVLVCVTLTLMISRTIGCVGGGNFGDFSWGVVVILVGGWWKGNFGDFWGRAAHHHHLADRGGLSPPPPLFHPHAPHHPTHRHRQGRRPAPPTPPLLLKRCEASRAMTSPCTTRFRGVAMAAHRRAALPTSSDAVLWRSPLTQSSDAVL